MGGDSEYEPKDSRNVTGEAHTPDGRWSGDRQPRGHGGEYEPRDSRNVTGTASTPDGRWTNAAGNHSKGLPNDEPVSSTDTTGHPENRDDQETPEREEDHDRS